MIVGYARVSTEDQNLDLQLRALRAAGCKQVYTDHGLSGKGFDRPGLLDALASLKPGGVLVVWRLDRLGRSLIKLVHLVD
ncbi:recombinase family protein, partial [Agrobacterium rhizogenes]|nr:recombinase family protein [Rhizobium rhizogenes]